MLAEQWLAWAGGGEYQREGTGRGGGVGTGMCDLKCGHAYGGAPRCRACLLPGGALQSGRSHPKGGFTLAMTAQAARG